MQLMSEFDPELTSSPCSNIWRRVHARSHTELGRPNGTAEANFVP